MTKSRDYFLSMALSVAVSALSAADGIMMSTVGKSDCVPVIDGVGDRCYGASMPLCGFTFAGRADLAFHRTEIRMVHDGRFLYGLCSCRQNDAKEAAQGAAVRKDPAIWHGNSIELFFETDDGLRYYAFSPQGSVNWEVGHRNEANKWVREKEAKSDVRFAVSTDERNWFVEFAIPLAELPGRSWGFNAVRNRTGTPASCWQRQAEGGKVNWWGDEAVFGSLRLTDESLASVAFDRLPKFDPRQDFSFAVTNSTGMVIYDYRYEISRPFVKIVPANLRDDCLVLNGNRGLKATISWDCRHNYPDVNLKEGRSVKMPVVLTFKLPPGVALVGGRKVGTENAADGLLDVYEQSFPKAYNAKHWMKSSFTSTLAHGSSGEFVYSMRYRDGEQAVKKLRFQVIDVPLSRRPKRFVTGFYNLWVKTTAEAEYWAGLGVNTFAVRGYGEKEEKLCRDLRAHGWQVRKGDYFWPGSSRPRGFDVWTKEDETARALDVDGKPIVNGKGYLLSASYRGRFFQEAVEKDSAFARVTGLDWFAFDMEDYVQGKGELGDFRPECLARFGRNWRTRHPDAPVPDPRAFERQPEAHPEAHRIWVETKCELWGGFFADLRRQISEKAGHEVRFSEWSMNAIADIDKRNHSLRGADFFREFFCIELDTYSGVDRDLRQIEARMRDYRREFPGVPLDVLLTPYPGRLGTRPGGHYWTTAPEIKDEQVCVFKEAMTLGARGVYTWHISVADMDYLRQFVQGVNLVCQVEDLVLDGKRIPLSSDFPNDAEITDGFFGTMQTWKNQPRVFTRGVSLGDRTLVSVSEYRACKPMEVKVCFSPAVRVEATDLETGETIGRFGPEDRVLPVRLPVDRRCRLVLLKPVEE